ncbi:unnamed protein product [Musa acuminata subsp. burmannicoides]
MIITGNNEIEISKFHSDLCVQFEIKVLGELNMFLDLKGMNIKEGVFISQISYAKKIIKRFGRKQSKKVSTLLDTNIKLSCNVGKILSYPQSIYAFINSLIYLTITRPYVAFSIGLVIHFM